MAKEQGKVPSAEPKAPGQKKTGRPSSYRESFADVVEKSMAEGLSKEAVAGVLGVSKQTLYDWSDPKSATFQPAFLDAIKRGETLSQLFWERMGIGLALKGGGGQSVWIFNMKNRFGWRDPQDIDVTTGGESLGVVLLPQKDLQAARAKKTLDDKK